MLHRLGHEVLLDATSLEMLKALDVALLGFDYVKIFWHDFITCVHIDVTPLGNSILVKPVPPKAEFPI